MCCGMETVTDITLLSDAHVIKNANKQKTEPSRYIKIKLKKNIYIYEIL